MFGSRLLRADGATADDLVPTGRPGHRAPFARWRGDLAAAKRLLGDAGWREQSGGRPRRRSGAELTLVLAVPRPSDVNDIVVRGIQVQLRALGVQLGSGDGDADQAAELARARQADLSIAPLGHRHRARPRPDVRVHGDARRPVPESPAGRTARPTGGSTRSPSWPRRVSWTDRRRPVLDRLADQVPVLPLYTVHPVLGAGKMTLPPPLAGYGGPFAAVDRWAMAG